MYAAALELLHTDTHTTLKAGERWGVRFHFHFSEEVNSLQLVKKFQITECTFNIHGFVHCINIVIYIQQDATLHSLFFWKLLYMFRVVPPPITRSVNKCIYSIWYLSHRYCYLPLSWKSLN